MPQASGYTYFITLPNQSTYFCSLYVLADLSTKQTKLNNSIVYLKLVIELS
jgi:hypothetical protein